MKQLVVLATTLFMINVQLPGQSVGIGTPAPHTSAILDLSSDSLGILIPRMTDAQRDSIANPADGLLVYVTTDSTFYCYDGSSWVTLNTRTRELMDTDEDTRVIVEGAPDDDVLRFETAGIERMRVDSVGRVGIGTQNPGGVITNAQMEVMGGHIMVSNNFGVLSYNQDTTGFGAGFDTHPDENMSLIAGGESILNLSQIPTGSAFQFGTGSTGFNTQFEIYTTALQSGAIAMQAITESTGCQFVDPFPPHHCLIWSSPEPGNLLLNPDGGKVGIGTTIPGSAVPNAQLDVVGGHVSVSNDFGFLSHNNTGDGVGAGFDTHADDGLSIYSGGATRMKIDPDGSIGIGTTAPDTTLHVVGSIKMVDGNESAGKVLVSDISGVAAWGTTSIIADTDNDTKVVVEGTPDDDVLRFETAGSERLRINSTGNVGIGTNSPASVILNSKLDVVGGHIAVSNDFGVLSYNNSGTGIGAGFDTHTDDGLSLYAGGATRMTIEPNGDIGIGTTTPSYPLQIVGGVSGPNPAHYLHHTIGVGQNGTGWSYSIHTDLAMYSALGFGTGSDVRIKDVIGRSDSKQDLASLLQLRITDYRYKDTLARGTAVVKKIIAQEVEQILPQAVTTATEVIPDIYTMATVQKISDSSCTLLFDGDTGLEAGQRVRVILPDGSYAMLTVIHAAGETVTFHNPDRPFDDDRLFVYGREVDDFLSVDYDAISMLNVSATQELAKQNARLRAELDAQKKINAATQSELASLSEAIEQIKRALGQ